MSIQGETLVKVEGVSKKFCRSLKKSLWYGLSDLGREVLSGGKAGDHALRAAEFWAVDDVSFELRRGECLGLIGRNGAGKTTLLKMLNGLIKPDHGRIEMRGRVGALIALGAGFNPLLTGRENIYVNASVLGLTKREVDGKIEEIIDFSDIRDFIDAPVQSYSSGMQVRLGFAVATALDPDVLLLDEVLAVGDAAFRNKCYRRIASLRKTAAVVFVSHNMNHVARTCDRILAMSHGCTAFLGDVDGGVEAYEKLNEDKADDDRPFLSVNLPVAAFDAEFPEADVVSGAPFPVEFLVECAERLPRFVVRIFFYNASGAFAAEGTFPSENHGMVLPKGASRWRLVLDSLALKSGRYRIGLNMIGPKGDLIVWSYKQHEIQVRNTWPGAIADCQLRLASWSSEETAAAVGPDGASVARRREP